MFFLIIYVVGILLTLSLPFWIPFFKNITDNWFDSWSNYYEFEYKVGTVFVVLFWFIIIPLILFVKFTTRMAEKYKEFYDKMGEDE